VGALSSLQHPPFFHRPSGSTHTSRLSMH
jgi:hypothetical protein